MLDRQMVLNKINLLNYLNFNIIEVIHSKEYSEFFVSIRYEAPSQFSNELVIKGKQINGLIKNEEISLPKDNLQQQEFIKTKIENLPIYSKRYSKSFSYIIHLS